MTHALQYFYYLVAPFLYSRVVVDDINPFLYGLGASIESSVDCTPTCRHSKYNLLSHTWNLNILSPFPHILSTKGVDTSTFRQDLINSTYAKSLQKWSSLIVKELKIPLFRNLQVITTDMLQYRLRCPPDGSTDPAVCKVRDNLSALLLDFKAVAICQRYTSKFVRTSRSFKIKDFLSSSTHMYHHVYHSNRDAPIEIYVGITNTVFCAPLPGQISQRLDTIDTAGVFMIHEGFFRAMFQRLKSLIYLQQVKQSTAEGEVDAVCGTTVRLYGLVRTAWEEDISEEWRDEQESKRLDNLVKAGYLSLPEEIREIMSVHLWKDRPVCPGCDGKGEVM
jgi:hypothetical protein